LGQNAYFNPSLCRRELSLGDRSFDKAGGVDTGRSHSHNE
jgi:hypothetical protein